MLFRDQINQSFVSATKAMWETLKCPDVWRPCLYMYLSFSLSLNISEGMFYWATDSQAGPSFSKVIYLYLGTSKRNFKHTFITILILASYKQVNETLSGTCSSLYNEHIDLQNYQLLYNNSGHFLTGHAAVLMHIYFYRMSLGIYTKQVLHLHMLLVTPCMVSFSGYIYRVELFSWPIGYLGLCVC